MSKLLHEGALLLMKRPLFVDGYRFYTTSLIRLNSIREVCEERVYYITLNFLYLDGTGQNFSWTLSHPIDESTGSDLFDLAPPNYIQKSEVPTEEPSGEPYIPPSDH